MSRRHLLMCRPLRFAPLASAYHQGTICILYVLPVRFAGGVVMLLLCLGVVIKIFHSICATVYFTDFIVWAWVEKDTQFNANIDGNWGNTEPLRNKNSNVDPTASPLKK